MKLLRIGGTLIILVLYVSGVVIMIDGFTIYNNTNFPMINFILILLSFIGLFVIAIKGIQVIWKV